MDAKTSHWCICDPTQPFNANAFFCQVYSLYYLAPTLSNQHRHRVTLLTFLSVFSIMPHLMSLICWVRYWFQYSLIINTCRAPNHTRKQHSTIFSSVFLLLLSSQSSFDPCKRIRLRAFINGVARYAIHVFVSHFARILIFDLNLVIRTVVIVGFTNLVRSPFDESVWETRHRDTVWTGSVEW